MSKYKRWILLLTALTVFVVHTESLKATSLIHAGKFSKLLNTTTSTTTEGTPTTDDNSTALTEGVEEPEVEEEKFRIVNGTKIPLTGIPQIDYVWDPNLPRELNGFNLSHYPFLDSMPAEEDIGFDCEEKINGFYASMKYGCQLYHHCLYGVRNDFICANFTAFDQKTFICHFASEVDCKNSYKYWNRNDDLYKATTEKVTAVPAGLAPLFDRNLYKRPSPGSTNTGGLKNSAPPLMREPQAPLSLPGLNSPSVAAVPGRVAAADDLATLPIAPRPGARPMRRPYRRRRPQIDYYYYDDDDYEEAFYDDRGRRRQQRPRNRRPVYDDYDSRRPETRRPANDDFDDYEYDRRPYRNRNRSESRKNGDDRRKQDDRRFDDRRRPDEDDRKPIESRKRPQDERRSYSDDRRSSSSDDRRQPSEDRKKNDEERSQSDERKSHRRKNYEDTTEDKPRDRVSERSELTEKRQAVEDSAEEKPLKSSSSSIFDRPRPLPKISRPVPLSEKNIKYSLKTQAEKASNVDDQKKKDEEYYEEYDDVPAALLSSTTTTTVKPPTRSFSSRTRPSTTLSTTKKPTTTTTMAAQEIEYYEDEDYDVITEKIVETTTASKTKDDRSSFFNSRLRNSGNEYTTSTTTNTPSAHDNFRLNRFKSPNEKEINKTAIRDNAQKLIDDAQPLTTSRKPLPSIISKKFASQQTLFESTTMETPKTISTVIDRYSINPRILLRPGEQVEADVNEEKDPKYLMRVIKRPFLPSRGGNPYKGRGLQAVGPASQQQLDEAYDNNSAQFSATGSELSPLTNDNMQDSDDHQQSLVKSSNNQQQQQQQQQQPQQQYHQQQQHQQYPGEIHKTTLEDIYNEEYDVELNDALNPMLKPLTSSRGISGFSFSSLPIDDQDGFRSQSQKSIQTVAVPKTTSTTTTSTEAPQYEYEEVEYEY